jgi:adenylate cyclase
MTPRNSAASLVACLVGLLVLLVLAAMMTLDLGGITEGFRGVQSDIFARIQPGMAAAVPAQDLARTSFDQIGSGEGLNNAAALWPQLLFLLMAGGLMLVLIARGRTAWAGVFTVLVIAAALVGSWFLFARTGMFVDALTPSVMLALSYAAGALVASALRPSRTVVTRAVEPSAEAAPPAAMTLPRIPPERRTVSYLVCRLGGVAKAETLEAKDAMTLLEGGLAPLLEAVSHHGGTVVLNSGTRFAAVWNAPAGDADYALHACEAALGMMTGLTQLKDAHGENTPYESLYIAVGIATGPAMAGSIRNGQDAYSVVGACTETADRLSRLSSRYGAALLVDEETRNAAEKNFAMLEIDTVAREADGKPMKIYALYGNPLVRASPKFRALSSFHDHLFQAIRAQRWNDARDLIGQCGNLSGAIPQLYGVHGGRIAWYESHSPPSDWDGAFRPPVI